MQRFLQMRIEVVSRIVCKSRHYTRYDESLRSGLAYVFSNYNSSEPTKAKNHTLFLEHILREAFVPSKRVYADPCGGMSQLSPEAPYDKGSAAACCSNTSLDLIDRCPYIGYT